MPHKILFITAGFGIGGTETHLMQIVAPLQQKGYSTSIYPMRSSMNARLAKLKEQGVDIILLPKFHDTFKALGLFTLLLHLLCHILRTKPQICHCFLPKGYLIGGFCAWLARVPIRIMSRRSLNNYLKKYPKAIRRYEYWLHRKMTAIFGNAQRVVDQLHTEEHVPPHKLHLIYNGITPPDKEAAFSLREKLNIPDHHLIVIMVANLFEYKGHRDVIEALGDLHALDSWSMVFIGRDQENLQTSLEGLAKHHHIQKRIHFLGQQDNAPTLLHQADIALLASHEEGFSNAILEAMAVGLPLVVTDVGGNAEAVLDQENGFVVPARHPEAFAHALQTLINDPALRKKFSTSNQERFHTHFLLEHCVTQYDQAYKALLS